MRDCTTDPSHRWIQWWKPIHFAQQDLSRSSWSRHIGFTFSILHQIATYPEGLCSMMHAKRRRPCSYNPWKLLILNRTDSRKRCCDKSQSLLCTRVNRIDGGSLENLASLFPFPLDQHTRFSRLRKQWLRRASNLSDLSVNVHLP